MTTEELAQECDRRSVYGIDEDFYCELADRLRKLEAFRAKWAKQAPQEGDTAGSVLWKIRKEAREAGK